VLEKSLLDRYQFDAEGLAEAFSVLYFTSHERCFPLNPFQVLHDLNVPFVFRNLDKLEGVFLPGDYAEDSLVALNKGFPFLSTI
jgi:hypothetical protein